MRAFAREVIVTLAAAIFLAGPVAALVVPLSPESWRSPLLLWGLLLGAVALVVRLRRRRWRRP